MNRTLRAVLPRIWQTRGWPVAALLPFAWLYTAVVAARRRRYRSGKGRVQRFERPVVVVGGITVGGSGKTPLTLHVARLLAANGYRPGIVSRGYGGRRQDRPLRVERDTPPEICGDEAAMMAARDGGWPVVVDVERPRGVRWLIEREGCDVVISDDGLQHYAMDRRVEIAVLGRNGLGNGYCLPAGPLREPATRLDEVDLVVRNGAAARPGEFGMALHIDGLLRLDGGEEQPATVFAGRRVHGVAGTGHPGGFFETLSGLGMTVEPHPFPDHHRFTAADFSHMDDAPIVMTEKDAVKCTELPLANAWYAKATAVLDERFDSTLIELLKP